jgi:Tol biopolymer transport system component
MPLASGTKLGPYEILSAIGAGGMGKVYRARDTKLGRDVALKILREIFAVDGERLARFEREAKTLAALNHPHIAIYGFEQSGATSALVMELVEGEDLAQRIARGPIPLDEALVIARQIAEGLEAAHEHGIIHRDLKPANIKVRRDGTVKVLDFGLAKAAVPDALEDPGNSPTFTSPATRVGVILGTAAYMSPEQARARAVDKRADIWAFGCVLYEMLCGRPVFGGDTITDILAAVVQHEPDWNALPASTPAPVLRLLRRCLVKDPKHRLTDMADARLELEDAIAAPHASGSPGILLEREPGLVGRRSRGRAMWIAAALIFAGLASAATWWLRPSPAEPRVVTRWRYPLPDDQKFPFGITRFVTITPDGRKIAYVANRQLYIRDLDQLDAKPLPGTDEDPFQPVFSPNGKSIVYFTHVVAGGEAQIRKVAVTGGAPVTLARTRGLPSGATWHRDLIVFGQNAPRGGEFGVHAVNDSGGTPRILVSVDGKTEHAVEPQLLDDERHVLFSVQTRNYAARVAAKGEGPIVVQAIGSTTRKVLVPLGLHPRVLPTGHLVYLHNGTLFGVRFDARRLEITGDTVPLVEGILQTGFSSAAHLAISRNGSLVYARGINALPIQLLINVDRQGTERPLIAAPNEYEQPRISPDRTRLAISVAGQIWIWTFATETLMRLSTNDAANHWNPVWMGDRHVVFDSNDGSGIQIVRTPADGSGAEEVIVPAPAGYPNTIAADGKFLLYHDPAAMMLMPLPPSGEARPLFPNIKGRVQDVEVSPDQRRIAYASNESGRFEIYVRPYPEVDGGRWQISTDGGQHPLWSRDGRELFFIAGDGMMTSVPIQPGALFGHGRPTRLFPAGHYYVDVVRNYELTPDRKAFIMVKNATPDERQSIVVVTNWFDELRAKMGAAR